MAWSDPKTWTADELLTASDMNQYISDNLSALYNLIQGGGRKNLLHNGAMQVAQRGTSTASITTSGYYTADRWFAFPAALGTWTQSVENDAPTGSGFRKSLKMLVTTADASPSASDYAQIYQKIEGQNLQSVKKGTASAQPLTLSFWTKSNKTGTYIVELYDADNTRTVSATYTVASSGTWEQQSITFPADASGALDNDANASLTVSFWLAAGTDFTSGALATTWGANAAANRAVGQTNLASDTSNYWMLTGVQLEVGSAATGFEFKGYETELAECQRYFYMHAEGDADVIGTSSYWANAAVYTTVHFPVTMRVTPDLYSSSGTGYFSVESNTGTDALNSLTRGSTPSSPRAAYIYNTTEASGTAGNAGILYTSNASAYVGFSADL